jgi:hypothetical protein
MRILIPLLMLALVSACTHEPDYIPTGVSGPGGEYVAFISPSHGETLTGLEDCTISVSASQGVAEVDFYVDDQYTSTDRQRPYKYSWPSYQYSGGSHRIKAIGKSMGQAVDTDQITVKLKRRHIYVDDDAGSNGVGRKDNPTPSLSMAAFLSSAGDTIHVATGYYNDNYEADTRYGTKEVCAMLAGGVSVIGEGAENTTIDCTGSDAGIFYSEGQAGGLIEGLTILNADEACIYVSYSDPTIRDCEIRHSNGSGIYVRDCEREIVSMIRCHVESNAGGGIHIRRGDAEVYYSVIRDNGSAGILCERYGFPKMRMDVITGNQVGVFIDIASSPNITRCDIFDNHSYNIELGYGQLVDRFSFRQNWWGAVDGESIEESIFHAVDDSDLPRVDFSRWLAGPVFPQPESTE